VQSLDCALYSYIQPAQNPLTTERQLLGILKTSSSDKAVPQVNHGKFDGIPKLVAPVSVCNDTLDV